MDFHFFSTITQRRAERPMLVTIIGGALLIFPLVISIFLIAVVFSGRDTTIGMMDVVAQLGALGMFSVLGYGLLALNRISYWIFVTLLVVLGITEFIDLIRIGPFTHYSISNYLAGCLGIGFLLQRSVRSVFRY